MPHYSLGNSVFGLIHYPSASGEWTLERKMAALHQREYTHMEGDFGGENLKSVRSLSEKYGLELGYIRFGIRSKADMEQLVREASEAGATYVVVIAGHAYDEVQMAVDYIGTYRELANQAGLPFYLETHRDSVTQDLARLNELIRQLPALSLIVDWSHLLVGGEITPDLFERHWLLFDALMNRTCGFHGRISNGQQIQINIASVSEDVPQAVAGLWTRGIEGWLAAGKPKQPFRFTVELGPPPYALTKIVDAGGQVEISDRLEQGELLKILFQDAWNQAVQNQNNSTTK